MPNTSRERQREGVHDAPCTDLQSVAQELCAVVASTYGAPGVAVIGPAERAKADVVATQPMRSDHDRAAVPHRISSFLEPHAPATWTIPFSRDVGSIFGSPSAVLGNSVIGAQLRIGNSIGLLIFVSEEESESVGINGLGAIVALAEQMFDNAHRAAISSRKLTLEHQRNRELAAAAKIGRHVFHKLLEGGDTASVLDHLSQLVRKPVILYTADFIVTAWSAPPGFDCPIPPRVPVNVVNQAWFAKTVSQLTSEQPCLILGADSSQGLTCRHLLGRLTVHDRVTGYLDIVGIGQEIQPVEKNLVELATLALSMQQLSEMLQLENEGRDQEDYLSELLRNGKPERLARRAPIFGVDLARKHVLVRVEYRTADGDKASVGGAVRRARLIDELAQELVVGPPIAVGVPGADVLLLRVPRTESPKEGLTVVRQGIETLAERLRDWVDVGRVIVSEPCEHLSDYAPAHRDLFSFSQLAEERGWRDGVYLLSELGVLRLILANSSAADSNRFASRMLASLETYDVENGAELTVTMNAFLESNGRIHLTAQQLGVHDNTIRYRLGRIESILERSVDSLDDLMEFRLAFQIRALYGRQIPTPATGGIEPELKLVQS